MHYETEELIHIGYRYALALRGDAQDAEDLVHEAWLRLHRQLIPHIDKPRLLRTIRNLFIDRYRRDQLLVVEALDDHLDLLPAATTPLERQVGESEFAAHLARLRAPEREALFLNVVEGYTVREIVNLTGRPRGTVLSLIHRAKQRLRAALEAEDRPSIAEVTRGETR